MRRVKTAIIIALVVLIASAAFLVASAADYGSADDPLVTLSYITKVVVPDIITKVTEQLKAGGVGTGEASATSSTEYMPIMLSKGQTIFGKDSGIEVLLRRGGYQVVDPKGDKIVNLTKGTEAGEGPELMLQNLYMIPRADQRGIRATADESWVLVRGSFEIK